MTDPTADIKQALERIAEWETNHVKTPEITTEKERLLRQLAIFESVRIDATPSVSSTDAHQPHRSS